MPVTAPAPTLRARDIVETVADFYGYTVDDMRRNDRTKHLSQCRQVAMYLCREGTALSYPAIGRIFDRDHTTVLYAYRKVSDQLQYWQRLGFDIAAIVDRLHGRTA